MKIAIVSDSHGDLFTLDKVIESLKDVDKIIHLGDHYDDIVRLSQKYNKDIIYVAGNNDWDYGDTTLQEKTIEVEGIKIFLTHGHRYKVNFSLDRLYYRGKEVGANIVLFGHTHKQFYSVEDNMSLFNPGSISYPRDKEAGYGVITISNGIYSITPARI